MSEQTTASSPGITDPLPCPFCGEAGEIRETHRDHWVVQCTNEHCLVHRQPELSPLAAVAVWNERANVKAEAKP